MMDLLKRAIDLFASAGGLLVLSPLLLIVAVLITSQDGQSPFYIAPRVGRGGRPFRMVKFRSMVLNADKSGVTSTSATDSRITPIGAFVRRYKLDEIVQLWNVLRGDMSLVGPRPNVESGTRLYSKAELGLLSVRPGITDIASIVFADEGEILKGHADADLAYDQLIRPWKSRLGMFYVDNRSTVVDLRLIELTVLAVISRDAALVSVSRLLGKMAAAPELVRVALRREALTPG
jgi:lipopolysaccharide/colanic/teichoic acid biosynthesis glycosyltransferase